ncbi:MAG: SusC/RagA family TonB-linked outer membrane protein [Bacteroidota bacterium]
MRFSCLVFSLFFSLQLVSGEDMYAQDWEMVFVSIDAKNATLVEIFNQLESKTVYTFRYDSKIKNHKEEFSLSHEQKNVKEILEELANLAGLRIKLRNSTISVVKKSPKRIYLKSEELKEKEVSGRVIEAENGNALEGVKIQVKGTTIGAFTNTDGTFSITVPDDASILIVSFVGYGTEEIEIAGRSTFEIELTVSFKDLDEVIVVGYGTQDSYKVSAAVQQINSEELEIDKRPISTIESSLVGSLPGLILDQNSGELGAQTAIQIRGASGLSSRNALVLVDGFESSVENLNPADIESVSILKDAAAAAIYGARGANGVVLITTKRTARSEDLTLTFSSNLSLQAPNSTAELVDSRQFMETFNAAQFADRVRVFPDQRIEDFDFPYSDEDIARAESGFYPETNWVDELYNENAIQSLQNLSVQGGSAQVGYLMNLGYLSQNGISQGPDKLERISLRLKVDADISPWLSIGANIFNAYRDLNRIPLSTNNGLRGQPFFPVRLDAGPFAGAYVFKGSTSNEENPIAKVNSGSFDQTLSDELNLQLYGILKPIENLALEGRFSYVRENENRALWDNPYEYIILDEESLEPTGNPVPFTNNDRSLTEISSRSFSLNTLLTANYTQRISEVHNLDILLGFQAQEGQARSISASRFGYILPNLQSLNLGNQIIGFGNTSNASNDRSTLSYFSRLAYDFQAKYLLEFSFRADASSNFVKDKWGFFPAVSIGWNIDRESFLEDVNDLDLLKLRASWGINGDDGSLSGIETVITNPAGIAFGGNVQPIILLNNTVNPNLTWETSQKANLGLDVVLWKGKLDFTGDIFVDNREDIIANVLTAAEGGLDGILANVYDARSWGWEFNLEHQSKIGKFGINASLNLSFYNNKITQGAGNAPLNITPENFQLEGFPTINWFGYETAGYFQSEEELASWVNSAGEQIDQSTVVSQGDSFGRYVGGYRFVDQMTIDTNGDGIADTPDGVINGDDRKILLENAVDNYRIGGTIGFSYQRFTVSARIYGVLKSNEWLNSGNNLNAFTSSGVAPFVYQTDTWSPENPTALFSQAYAFSRPYNADISDLIIERDYIKFKNINLAYSFGPRVLEKLKVIQSLDLYASFENIGIIWTNYPLFEYGFDPEFGANGFNYPLSLKSSVGVNLQF